MFINHSTEFYKKQKWKEGTQNSKAKTQNHYSNLGRFLPLTGLN